MTNKRYFRIELYGYGGEVVMSPSSEAEYEYWNSEQALADTGTEDAEDALFTYLEEHEFESERFRVPEQFSREGQWYEQDSLLHENGVDFSYGHVNVYEMDGPDWDAHQTNTVVEDLTIVDFIQNHNADAESTEFETEEQYVFFGMSSDKGAFYNALIELDGEIDLSKIKFHSIELPTGDEIINSVTYGGEELSNEGGDTNNKGITVQIIEL
jgi:hypothetical protein